MSDEHVSVLVVDDQTIIHDMARRVLPREPDMSVVGVAATVREALAQAHEHRSDVADDDGSR